MLDMSAFRRYEILVPLSFNDGTAVPEFLLRQTFQELEDHFGNASSETQVVRGSSDYYGMEFRDKNARLFVDVPDLPAHREFFKRFKELLKGRFQQIDIWITSHPLEVL
jgi:hypothetical protein